MKTTNSKNAVNTVKTVSTAKVAEKTAKNQKTAKDAVEQPEKLSKADEALVTKASTEATTKPEKGSFVPEHGLSGNEKIAEDLFKEVGADEKAFIAKFKEIYAIKSPDSKKDFVEKRALVYMKLASDRAEARTAKKK